MDSLRLEITANFGVGHLTQSTDVVLWDGFDQLEKESAVEFYRGKTWPEVLAHLRSLKNAPVFGAAYYLEEWSVLSQAALPYYLRAHLEFLLETISSSEPDEDFIFRFFGQLYQVIYMHKGSPFNPVQTGLLKRVAQSVAKKTNDQKRFPYYFQDIKDQIEQFLAELRAHND